MNSPASSDSSPPLDFQTALGRLLCDGALRDRFRADPGVIPVDPADRVALLGLDLEDLEFQARVLLRKRFVALAPLLPQTLARFGEKAWPLFAEIARVHSPISAAKDALLFCSHLAQNHPGKIVPREHHRLCFAESTARFRLHLMWPAAVQILCRTRRGPREWVLRFG